MRSEALSTAQLGPARKTKSAFVLVGFFALMVALPCFTGCTAASSAATGKTQVTDPRTPPNSNANSRSLKLSGALAAGEVGSPYNATVSVSGGQAAYNFSLSWGSLPPGLTLHGNTGTISGSPTKKGTYEFGIHVTDSGGLGGANAFSITISDSGSVGVSLTPSITTVASSGTTQFTASVTNTSDVGVTWSATSGTISSTGLYTAPSVKATTNVTVTATSSADATKSASASVTVTGTVQSSLSISTTSLNGATSGTSYSYTLKASGGSSPYNWSLSSGSLPSGLAIKSGGTISGTTTQTGNFSFTVQATDGSSPMQSATQSLTLAVSSSSANGVVPATFFGADFNGSKVWPPTDGQNNTAMISSVRLWDDGLKWGQLETSNGKYDWGSLDNWLDRASSSNMDVLYTFGDTPQFAAASKAPGGCLVPGPYSCAAPTDVNSDGTGTDAYFQAFVTALVTHAAGRIAYYELWNEPDCNCFWAGTQAQLVRMGKDAAAIIRSLDPNAKILSPSAHGGTMKTWFDGYIDAGGAPNFDIVNVHMRGEKGDNADPEAFLAVWADVQTEVQKRNLTNLPIWDDEHGILSSNGMTDPDMLAGYVARSAALRAGVGIQRQYIYTWDSHAPYGLQGSSSGTSWNVVAGWLIGHSISPCTAAGTVYTCSVDNGLIVWDSSKTCSKGVCGTSNYTYPSNYVWSHDLDGNRTALSGKTVAIGYKPIMLSNE